MLNEHLIGVVNPFAGIIGMRENWYKTTKNSCFEENFLSCFERDFQGNIQNLIPILTIQDTDKDNNCDIIKIDIDFWKINESIKMEYFNCSRLIIIGKKKSMSTHFKEISLKLNGNSWLIFNSIFSSVSFKKV